MQKNMYEIIPITKSNIFLFNFSSISLLQILVTIGKKSTISFALNAILCVFLLDRSRRSTEERTVIKCLFGKIQNYIKASQRHLIFVPFQNVYLLSDIESHNSSSNFESRTCRFR